LPGSETTFTSGNDRDSLYLMLSLGVSSRLSLDLAFRLGSFDEGA
jgi:hypothetical protein